MQRAASSLLTTYAPRAAFLAGRAVGWLRRSVVVRSLPGAGGALAVAYGLGQIYHPLFWGVVARAKLAAGYIIGWDDAHPVPISELYYLGGINSVRGYRLLSISPSIRVGASPDPSAATADFFTGGNKQVTLNLELEFPLFEKVGIKGVVFYDLGNTFKQGNFFSDPDHPGLALSLFKSVGFGFRWFSPIGPLRFEWGIPLDRRKDVLGNYIDNALDFQFTIGNFF